MTEHNYSFGILSCHTELYLGEKSAVFKHDLQSNNLFHKKP